MTIEIQDYNHERDYDAIKQIWLDVGWLDEDNLDDHENPSIMNAVLSWVPRRSDAP